MDFSSLTNSELIEASKELARRQTAMGLFQSLPFQDPVFLCDNRQVLVRGGCRSAKSMVGVAKLSSIVTDSPIRLSNGECVSMREKWTRGRAVNILVMAQDLKCLEYKYRMIFKKGCFNVNLDSATGVLTPLTSDSNSRVPAPAFISECMIDKDLSSFHYGTSFEKLAIRDRDTGEICAYINGITGRFSGMPDGAIDFAWIDETELEESAYRKVVEATKNVLGSVLVTTYPMSTGCICSLSDIASRTGEISEFVFSTTANAAIPRKDLVGYLNLLTEEEMKSRVYGQYRDEIAT